MSKSIPAKIIKEKYNGLQKKQYTEILKRNGINMKVGKGKNPMDLLRDERINKIIKKSNEYKEISKKVEKRDLVKNEVKERKEKRLEAKNEINYADNHGYDEPIVKQITNFSDFSKSRVAYNKIGASSLVDMYDNIRMFKEKNIEQGKELNSYVMYIKSKETGQIKRYITVKSRNISTMSLKNFQESIEDIMGPNEGKYGSDKVNEGEELEFSRYDAVVKKINNLEGKDSIKLFKTEGIDGGKDGLCVYECLKRILGEKFMTVEEFKNENLRNVKKLSKWIIKEGHKINLILTTPKKTGRLFNKSDDNYMRVVIEKRRTDIFRASIEEAQYIFVYGCKFPESDRFILIDIDGNHADLPKDNILQMNEFYFTESSDILVKEGNEYVFLKYNTNDIVTEHRRVVDNEIKKKPSQNGMIPYYKFQHCYIFYDYETICDFSEDDPIIPCSLGFVDIPVDQLRDEMNKCENFIDKLEELKKRIVVSHGKDCTNKLMDFINNSVNKIYTLVSFNGSRFDHYILYNEFTKQGSRMTDKVKDLFFVKNELLNFKIDGRHELFDLCKHVRSSLKDAGEGYGIGEFLSKKEISFYQIQKLYNENNYEGFVKKISIDYDYNNYLRHDILSMIALMDKHTIMLNCILGDKKYGDNIHKYKTAGGMMKKVMEDHLKEQDIKLPIFNKKQAKLFKDLKKNQVGGKVTLLQGQKKLEEQIYSIDCSGMYPYVMSCYDVYYPCGDIIEIKTYEEMPKNVIGFFYCSGIDQSNLTTNIIPEKLKNKTNDWQTKNIINNVLLSTVKIDMLKAEGCPINIANGFYFTHKRRSCDMFNFILNFMKIKSEQDIYKEKNDPRYNKSLRQVVKELMLILSGKLAEGLYLNKTVVVDENKYNNDYRFQEGVEFKNILTNGKAVLKINVDEAKALKNSKPIYISTLIYDYSQKYMREKLWNRVDISCGLYTDTDSMKMTKKGFDEWKEWAEGQIVPHWKDVERFDPRFAIVPLFTTTSMTKVLGSFVDEYIGKEINISYWLGKKRYFVGHTEKKENNCMTFNGIKKSDLFIKEGVIDENEKISTKELYELYNTHKEHSIENSYIEFFERLHNKQVCKVLVSSIVKSKDTLRLTTNMQIKDIVNDN